MPRVVAGALGIVSGFVALYAATGAAAHRTSGRASVYAIVTLSLSGAVIAATLRPNLGNVIAGVTTFYMVATALLTVIPTATRRQPVAAMVVGLTIAVTALVLGIVASAAGGRLQRMPAVIFSSSGWWPCSSLGRHQDAPRRLAGTTGAPETSSLAHVLGDVGGERLVLAGTSGPCARDHSHSCVAADPGSRAARRHGVLVTASPQTDCGGCRT